MIKANKTLRKDIEGYNGSLKNDDAFAFLSEVFNTIDSEPESK